MKRRNFITSLGAVAVGSFAAATNYDAIQTIIVGHTKDAISRISHDDEFVSNAAIEYTGQFDRSATGRDAAHWANGSVSVVDQEGTQFIQLEADFNSGPLPDGWVAVHPRANLQDESDTFTDDLIFIAPLKSGKGASVYQLPAEISEGWSVVIVCRRFKEYIGSATIA